MNLWFSSLICHLKLTVSSGGDYFQSLFCHLNLTVHSGGDYFHSLKSLICFNFKQLRFFIILFISECGSLIQVTEQAASGISANENVWSGQHIRSPLARAVYQKLKEDERNKNDRHVYVCYC